MIPTLIVLGLLALGVGIVAFATRRPAGAAPAPQTEQDTAWNDPITPADQAAPADDPFAHAPPVTAAPAPTAEETRP